VLAAEGTPERTIFHCFTGGPDEARRCLDLGAFLSFSGIVTFPSATDVHEAAALCPADRRLVETDSPYLAPTPHRGRTNQPSFVMHVVERIALLCKVPVEEVAAATVEASRQAFPALAHHG
jgi:TatD DNase family protein